MKVNYCHTKKINEGNSTLLFWIFCIFSIGIISQKCLEIVENCFQGNLLPTNTDTKNTENSKEQLEDHKKWILACFSHLVPLYLGQQNGEKNSKKRHLCDLSGSSMRNFRGRKKSKKKDAVLGTPDKSKI
jgi:hypothetical protein